MRRAISSAAQVVSVWTPSFLGPLFFFFPLKIRGREQQLAELFLGIDAVGLSPNPSSPSTPYTALLLLFFTSIFIVNEEWTAVL